MNIAEQIAFAATAIAALVWLSKLTWLLAQMATKVETLWAFQIRRAMSEVVTSGVGEKNSPLRLYEEARQRLDCIKDRLIEFCNGPCAKLDDLNTFMEIERAFGDELLDLICVPCKMSHGACVLVALSVGRQSDVIDIKFPGSHAEPR